MDYKNLWHVAKYYEIESLAEDCKIKIERCLTPDNSMEILHFSKVVHLKDLERSVCDYALR